MVEVIVQEDWYSISQSRENPKTLYVFGDNTRQLGCGGQAQIRYEPNSFGIPTKRLPSMDDDAFFSDQVAELLKMEQAISDLLVVLASGKYTKVVFPADGLGTGLSELPIRSPLAYHYLNDRLYECFGAKFADYKYPVEDYSDKWWYTPIKL